MSRSLQSNFFLLLSKYDLWFHWFFLAFQWLLTYRSVLHFLLRMLHCWVIQLLHQAHTLNSLIVLIVVHLTS